MSVKVLVRGLPAQFLPQFQLALIFRDALRLSLDLFKPASMALFLLALWRFSADLGWTSEFMISEGTFSHWQVWVALGFAMLGIQAEFEKRDRGSRTAEHSA